MKADIPTDYDTYIEIMGDLIQPINREGLDLETLKRLYQSKLIYLDNLRVKCFFEMNSPNRGHFSEHDYHRILTAQKSTHSHLRQLILEAISECLKTREKNKKLRPTPTI